MAKMMLKDQIKITVAAFMFFSCLYFVIAIWLKTDGVRFDPKTVYELLKDTLTLAAIFLAPVAAFVLFSDWKDQHKLIKNEVKIEEILLGLHSIDRKAKRFLNTSLNIRADAILLTNLAPLKPEIIKCLEDINEIYLQLRFFYFQTGDKSIQDVCNSLLIEIIGIMTQHKMCLDYYEVVMNSNNTEGYGKDFLEASKTLLLGSTKTYWSHSEEKLKRINSLSEKYIIKS